MSLCNNCIKFGRCDRVACGNVSTFNGEVLECSAHTKADVAYAIPNKPDKPCGVSVYLPHGIASFNVGKVNVFVTYDNMETHDGDRETKEIRVEENKGCMVYFTDGTKQKFLFGNALVLLDYPSEATK